MGLCGACGGGGGYRGVAGRDLVVSEITQYVEGEPLILNSKYFKAVNLPVIYHGLNDWYPKSHGQHTVLPKETCPNVGWMVWEHELSRTPSPTTTGEK